MRIAPFPFDRLPRYRRADVGALRRLRMELGTEVGSAFQRWAARYRDEAGDEAAWPAAAVRLEPLPVPSLDFRRDLISGAGARLLLRGPGGRRGLLLFDGRLVSTVLAMMLRVCPGPRSASATRAETGLLSYAVAGLLLELGPRCAWALGSQDDLDAGHLESAGAFEAQIVFGPGGGVAWLLVEDGPLASPRVEASLPVRPRAWLADHGLELPLELGRFGLGLLEIEQLGAGDVILSPDCPRPMRPWMAQLRIGSGGFPVVVEDARVRVEGPYRRGGKDMSGEASDRAAIAQALPVEVVVELGRLSLTAAEVMELAPGDVVALGRPLAEALDLRVGGRLFARGELVDVEGEAGVRLIEVYD
jgi:type III secretion system YscQ/HrcQ family protein